MTLQKALRTAFTILCVLAALKAGIDLLRVVSYEARGSIDSDVSIYFILGRGILNGLTPYKDLFESKPPGMFLFAALSLMLTGSQMLLSAASALVYLLIPAGFVFVSWRSSSAMPRWWRVISCIIAGLLGVAIGLYLEMRAGTAQTETFASFCLIAYGLAALYAGQKPSYGMTALLSILLFCACGLKEPFALVALGIGLLTADSPRHFLRIFVLPMLIALAAGTVLLFAFGWLDPYVHIQLPAMISGRASANSVETYSMKFFTVGRVFANLTTYYIAPLFGYVIALLWALLPVWKTGRNDWKTILLCIAQGILLYYFMIQMSLWVAAWNAHTLHLIIDDIPLGTQTWIILGFALPTAATFYLSYRWKILWHVLCGISVAGIAALTVGISIYATNHFAFAVPLYAVLALLFIRYASASADPSLDRIGIAAIVLLLTIVYRPDPVYLAHLEERLGYTEGALREETKRFDDMMGSCGFHRYFGPVGYQTLAFSHFSPLGPLPIPNFHEYLGKTHPLFVATHNNVRSQAPVILTPKGDPLPDFMSDLAASFTKEPPACASSFLPIDPTWNVYFRKSS